jgi:hypothetical protein
MVQPISGNMNRANQVIVIATIIDKAVDHHQALQASCPSYMS